MSNDKSFIEVQFPVSKISKESYKERKANLGQTLTGLGKWWGRKPLILVRATILGLLMPSSDNPKKDREIFLKILTMDEAGLVKRRSKSIPAKDVYQYLTQSERKRYFKENETTSKIEYKTGVTRNEKQELQNVVFKRISYDTKLEYCARPEEVSNIDETQWEQINEHLGTNAQNLKQLCSQLGEKKFGEFPVVGDCFSGGGSIPFEAGRMGTNVYASDLNPIAVLLTWASLHISGAKDIEKLREFQNNIFKLADKQILKWKIESNESGDRANSYLYCNETTCPECGYIVPLAPSWIIGKGTKTVAILRENNFKGFNIDIVCNASKDEIKKAESMATIQSGKLVCPHCKMSTPITAIRKDRRRDDGSTEYGLRRWGPKEFIPDKNDVFQERLYCIRYERQYYDENGNLKVERYYQAPTEDDLKREQLVVEILGEVFDEWQEKGYIPNNKIEEGNETTRLIRERGWTYWHQLYNPRQLLIQGLLMKLINLHAKTKEEKVIGILGVNKCCDWNSRLCIWNTGVGTEKSQNTFSNQALNTLYNYGCRGIKHLDNNWFFNINNYEINSESCIKTGDARQVSDKAHIWITDPPYADAVNYHELSEYFLAWDKKMLTEIFTDWHSDSRRALAVSGTGESFNSSMIDVYKNLSDHMPDNGIQVVMFTHQNVSVWADLTMILWSAGLQVTAAWNIATETESGGLKDGNYVKGTVLLVLRKQNSEQTAYLDELYPEIEEEVKKQIDSMRELDDKEDPNFTDADYLLAAYAASLKVLTSYKQIEDINVEYELSKKRSGSQDSPIERIINEAVKLAYDYLIPSGFDQFIWKLLIPEERFYIKGLDLEKDGVYQVGAYQELARGFGVREYKDLLASAKANEARLKTALEFGMRGLGDSDRFGSSVLRNILAAIHQSIKEEDTSKGRNWLKNELPNYWQQRNTIIEILDYISTLGNIENMGHWELEANYARLLCELIRNDGV